MQPSLRAVPADGIDLRLRVTDADVVAELQRLEGESEREAFALAALRIGILAIRQAGGAADLRELQDLGKRLVADVARVMGEHQNLTMTQIQKEMLSYFDRSNGKVPQFLDELVKPGGNLDRMMRQHLGGDTSTLAQTLTQHVGSQSPLLTMLSPEQKTGLLARVEDLVKKNLEEQRATMLGEFDLNKDQSALSRLVKQMKDGQGSLEKNFQDTIGKLASDWSLDNENSGIARFRKDVAATMEKLIGGQTAFQQAVMKELEGLRQKRASEAVSTAKGATFEEALGGVLRGEAEKAREIFQAVGLSVGEIKNCKKGDFVHEFGPESAAPGERIVVEAKDDAGYGLKEALDELNTARPNRKAQVGIFVFSRAVAPDAMARFQRFGNDIVLVWDKDDPATDLWLLAGLELGRALVVRRARAAAETSTSLAEIDTAIAQLEKDATGLQNIAISANTVSGAAEKIRDEVEKLQKKLAKQISAMREGIEALKGAGKP